MLNRIPAKTIGKLIWYFAVGVLMLILTNVLLYICRGLLQWPDVPSVAAAFALTTVLHFLIHNSVTFKDSKNPLARRLNGHLLVSVMNYFIGVAATTVVLKFVIDSNLIATVFSAAVTFFIGFVLLDRFVYGSSGKGKKDRS